MRADEIEVIDLRSLVPWDVDAVVRSVAKTGRCLVLHEAPLTGGFGGEVAARSAARPSEWLDAPVARLGALDAPVPLREGPRGALLAEGPARYRRSGDLLAY